VTCVHRDDLDVSTSGTEVDRGVLIAFAAAIPMPCALSTIARHTAIDLYRREARRPTARLDDASVAELTDVDDPGFDVWAVRQAIDELPSREREVVRLQHLESLTHAEIGARSACRSARSSFARSEPIVAWLLTRVELDDLPVGSDSHRRRPHVCELGWTSP
jgi:hypothetical protein